MRRFLFILLCIVAGTVLVGPEITFYVAVLVGLFAFGIQLNYVKLVREEEEIGRSRQGMLVVFMKRSGRMNVPYDSGAIFLSDHDIIFASTPGNPRQEYTLEELSSYTYTYNKQLIPLKMMRVIMADGQEFEFVLTGANALYVEQFLDRREDVQ